MLVTTKLQAPIMIGFANGMPVMTGLLEDANNNCILRTECQQELVFWVKGQQSTTRPRSVQNEHGVHFRPCMIGFFFMHEMWMIMIWKCWLYIDWEFMETLYGDFDSSTPITQPKCPVMDVAKEKFIKFDSCFCPVDHSRRLTSYTPWRSLLQWSRGASATLRLSRQQMVSF